MPAGFGSRLREKIESTRTNSSSGGFGSGVLGASKNIRGLTRLGGSGTAGGGGGASGSGDANAVAAEQQQSATSGLLSRKSGEAPNSPDKSARSPAGGAASSSAAHSSADASAAFSSHNGAYTAAPTAASAATTALGGSKIVPGWGAATSGHLGGIKGSKSAEQQPQPPPPRHSPTAVAAGNKNVPWAMHQPTSSGQQPSPQNHAVNHSNYQQSSSHNKPRWGDEDDDDSDDEFPQIGSERHQTNISSSTAAAAANSLHQQHRGNGVESTMSGGGYGGRLYSDRDGSNYQQSRRSYNDRYSNERYHENSDNYHRDYSQRGNYYDRNNNHHHHHDDYLRGGHGDDRGFRDFSGARGGGGGGGYDTRTSHHRDDYHYHGSGDSRLASSGNNDNRRSSSSSFYNDRRYYNDDESPAQSSRNDSRWGFAQRAPSHFSERRTSDDYHRHRSGSFDNNGHNDYRSSRRGGGFEGERGGGVGGFFNDREGGGDRYGFGNLGYRGGEDGGRVRSSSMASNNQDHRAEETMKQQLGIDANERINRSAPETPMLLLRSNNNNGSTAKSGTTTRPSGEVSSGIDVDMNAANLDGNIVSSNRVWSATPHIESAPTSTVGKILSSEQQTTSQQPSPVKRSPEEEEQFKKDRAIEQQQSILRQVAERRAARVSRTESDISADDKEPVSKWERGQKLSSRRSGDDTQILAKKPNPCRKNGHDHDWADCPDNRGSDAYVDKNADGLERGNRCRKPGHDHEWKHCPDNRKSEEYAAKIEEKKERKLEKEKHREEKHREEKNREEKHREEKHREEKPRPCRIEGHDHDWRECPKNPKSENFIRDNPCQIEGHDHDWVDCPDNPKSENYKPPKRKSKKGHKRTKEVNESNDSDAEEKSGDKKEDSTKPRTKKQDDHLARKRREESRILSKDSDEVQGQDEIEPVVVTETPEPKEFVPAPPPKVPAWSSGPPESIKKTSLAIPSDAEQARADTQVENASNRPSTTPAVTQQHQILEQRAQNIPRPTQLAYHESSAFSPAQPVHSIAASSSNTAQSSSITTRSTIQSHPILPPPNALFPGNSALFGESQGSAVYGSWNPPPMVLPSTYVDPWKPNPFAPTLTTATPIGASLSSIWSGPAVKSGANATTTSINVSSGNETAADSESNGEKVSGSIDAIDLLADVENGSGTKSAQKNKKQPRKPHGGPGKGKPSKEGKQNPCRKPGHDHDWKDCPDNRKSQAFAGVLSVAGASQETKEDKDLDRAEPSEPVTPILGVDKRNVGDKPKKKGNGPSKCRIEGHDHFWKDCPNNTKAAKGKGPKGGFKKKLKEKKTTGEQGNPSQSVAVEASS